MTESNVLPFVTIIMPIKNEERYIERSFGAVLNQDYPPDYLEVLIVDGCSTDRTREIIANLSINSKFSISVLDNPSGIVPKALNIGLDNAKGEIVIRVDGHCEIQGDYVRVCVNQLITQNVECVGGAINTVGDTYTAKTIALAMSTSFGVGNVGFRVSVGSTQLTDTVPFPAYPKRVFEQLGKFDEELLCNEDDEFNYRLLKSNGRILLVNDLKTIYYSRNSLNSLWKQYFRYGLWKVRVMQKHLGQMSIRQIIPAGFVLGLIASTGLALFLPWGMIPLAGVLALYIFANLSASLLTVFPQGWKHFPLLPITFSILHISYGLGFLIGLVKFWNRWRDKKGKVPELSL